MLNVCIIGPGKVADTLLAPALSKVKNAQLWSVVGLEQTRTGEFGARHGAQSGEPIHTDLAAALGDPKLHAVIIATPGHLPVERIVFGLWEKSSI